MEEKIRKAKRKRRWEERWEMMEKGEETTDLRNRVKGQVLIVCWDLQDQ